MGYSYPPSLDHSLERSGTLEIRSQQQFDLVYNSFIIQYPRYFRNSLHLCVQPEKIKINTHSDLKLSLQNENHLH